MKKLLFLSLQLGFFLSVFSQNFNYDVKYHRLDLKVDPAVHYIRGNVTTYFSVGKDSMSAISFNFMNQMQVDSVFFHNHKISFTHENDIITASLGIKLAPKILDSITIYYQGDPPNANGFGAFLTSTHSGTPIMWTLSEPNGARSWWPCKISLNDKADSVDMIVTAPVQYSVASNGLIVKIDTLNGNLKRTHWKTRYPITSYLIAFAVTNYYSYYDYANIGDTINLPILEMVYPEDSAKARKQTPDIVNVLKFYCDSFMLYPFWKEKYGQAQFNWGGGMEHQTMTFLVSFKHELMAHELAHQWFGDYITCASWHDIWLNEGFAVYLEGLTAEQGLAPYTWEDWKKNLISNATSEPDGSVYVEDTTNVNRIFDYRLTYMKGGSILHMLRWILGDKAFFEGLREYLRDPKLAFSYAKIDDLKAHLETAADTNLTEFFNDWYYGEGFPYYKIKWHQNKDLVLSIEIDQTGSTQKSPFFNMIIPLKLIDDSGKTQMIKLRNNINNQKYTIQTNLHVSQIIFDPDNWILTRNEKVEKISDTSELLIKISPNPAKDILHIAFPKYTLVSKITIYDIKGKLIEKEHFYSKKIEQNISVKNLQKGTYLLQISTEQGIIDEKFIKQ